MAVSNTRGVVVIASLILVLVVLAGCGKTTVRVDDLAPSKAAFPSPASAVSSDAVPSDKGSASAPADAAASSPAGTAIKSSPNDGLTKPSVSDTSSKISSSPAIKSSQIVASSGDWWHPPAGLTWQIEFATERVNTSVDVDVFDVDLFDTDKAIVDAIHADGGKAICYINAGSFEDWRPDKGAFPQSVKGNPYGGWEHEWWLDIRKMDVLGPIMRARLDLCKAKGFDAVDFDNVNAYEQEENATGFPIAAAEQIAYNKWLAAEAHKRGLAAGLKNNPSQAAELEPFFDFAVTEDCFYDGWCDAMNSFIAAGKPVLALEYTDITEEDAFLNDVCPAAGEMGFSAILKNRELDFPGMVCG